MSSESSAGPHGWAPSFPCPNNLERHLQMERYATPMSDIPTRLPNESPDHRSSSSPGPNTLRNLAMAYSQSVQAHTYQQMVKVVQKTHSLETIPVAVAERSISSTPSTSPTPEVKQEVFDDSGVLGLLQLPEDFVLGLPTPPPEKITPEQKIVFHRSYFFKRTSREYPGVYGYRLPWSLMRKGITARPEDILLCPDVTETGTIHDRKRVYDSREDMLQNGAERVHKKHRSKLREEIHPERESSHHQDNDNPPALWPVVVEDDVDSTAQLPDPLVSGETMQGTTCDGATWTRLTSLSNTQDVVPTSAPWDKLEPGLKLQAGTEADKENVAISVASLLN